MNQTTKGRLFKNKSLQFNILVYYVSLLVGTVGAVILYNYSQSAEIVLKLSDDFVHEISDHITDKTVSYLGDASSIPKISAKMTESNVLTLNNFDKIEQYGIQILKTFPHLDAFDVGDEAGNFLMPRRDGEGGFETKFIDRNAQEPSVSWTIRDANGNVVSTKTSSEVKYDPRARPWYIGAKTTEGDFWTDPYIFFTSQKPGITAASPIHKEGSIVGVFSVDIELEELSTFLKTISIGESGIAFIVNGKGEILAHPDVESIVTEKDGQLLTVNAIEHDDVLVRHAYQEFVTGNDNRFVFEENGQRHIASFNPLHNSFGKEWLVAIIVPEEEFIGPVMKSLLASLLMSLIILTISLLFASKIARNISLPIVALSHEANRIRDLDLDGEVLIESHIREIAMLSESIAAMKTGLKAFRKYVPASLVRQLIQTGEEAAVGGQKREITIFFSDIRGFTTIMEDMPPEQIMPCLNTYFDELTKIIMEEMGTVDKYIGDSIMAFWGAPVLDELHEVHGCSAALRCQKRLAELNKQWTDSGFSLSTRIGLHSGMTLVGNVGSDERMNYSVLGDSVNLASRLEALNNHYDTDILISEAMYKKVNSLFIARPVDVVAVKGKKQGIRIYELLEEVAQDTEQIEQMCEKSESAFDHYMDRDWDAAAAIYAELAKQFPTDKITAFQLERCQRFLQEPPRQGLGWCHSNADEVNLSFDQLFDFLWRKRVRKMKPTRMSYSTSGL